MRNPKWHRDEIILTLELYYDLESGRMSSGSKEVIELSELLNKLPIHTIRPDAQKFRNPNGVALKLGNFKFFDPDNAKAYYNRGVSKFYLEDLVGACKDAKKAQELGDDASVLIKRACLSL